MKKKNINAEAHTVNKNKLIKVNLNTWSGYSFFFEIEDSLDDMRV